MGISGVDLSNVERGRLRMALQSIMEGAPGALTDQPPTSLGLKAGASATLAEANDDAAKRFQSMLEIGYLVASADGFADDERHALAELLSKVTGATVSIDQLDLHFRDLEEGCEMLGRRERLRRAAEDFDDGIGRWEALGFAALVALADGQLADPEVQTLSELGGHFGLAEDQIADAISTMVKRVEAELGRTG
jgi:hypothetical protein